LRKLRQFQDFGHQVIFILGDFTAQIGDPSGRTETRPSLSREEILANARTYQEQIFKVLDRSKTKVVFNSEWLGKLQGREMLDLASRYTVAQLLERDDFQLRFREKNPISLLEFFYPLLQGYDSVIVEADVEVGGSDQKFNLLVGRELQRNYGKESQVIITLPLLEGTDGVRKMSKSYGNYIGINEPAKDIYGKLMSIPDSLMEKYYLFLTDHRKEEIEKIPPREAKARLAREITSFFYGWEKAKEVEEEFNRIFREKKYPQEMELISLEKSIGIVEFLVKFGLVESKKSARRLLSQGAVKINKEKIFDPSYKLEPVSTYVVQVGKRKYRKIIPKEK
jgi:tyrosyl-tRNA synthetase